jgi:hypothetical protein
MAQSSVEGLRFVAGSFTRSIGDICAGAGIDASSRVARRLESAAAGSIAAQASWNVELLGVAAIEWDGPPPAGHDLLGAALLLAINRRRSELS